MIMYILANLVGSTIQITTLPLPVLSTLQASGLVFNTICATVVLGEPFTRWSLVGTVLVAGGAVLIASFGALPEPSHNLEQLLDLLGRRQFLLWMTGTALIIAGIMVASLVLGRLHTRNTPRLRFWRGICFGSVSSILAAHSLLVAKSAVELLVRTIVDRKNQFKHWQSWIILLGLVFFALSQLYFLHRGLKLCSTSVLYPFVFCVYNIVAILDGLIYFRQASRLPVLHAGLIAVGTVVLLAGVFTLSWRLEEDPGAPPDAHSFLTPGMGIVEDTTTEDEDEDDDDSGSLTLEDEESALDRSDEQTPLLVSNGRQLPPKPKPKSKSNDDTILKVRRKPFPGARGGETTRDEDADEDADEDITKANSPKTFAFPQIQQQKRSFSAGSESPELTPENNPLPNRTRTVSGRERERRRRRSTRSRLRSVSLPVPRDPASSHHRRSEGSHLHAQDSLGHWVKTWWVRRRRGDGGGDTQEEEQ